MITYRLSDGAAIWQHRGDGNGQHIAIGPDGLVYVARHFDHITTKVPSSDAMQSFQPKGPGRSSVEGVSAGAAAGRGRVVDGEA